MYGRDMFQKVVQMEQNVVHWDVYVPSRNQKVKSSVSIIIDKLNMIFYIF